MAIRFILPSRIQSDSSCDCVSGEDTSQIVLVVERTGGDTPSWRIAIKKVFCVPIFGIADED